MTLPVKRTKTGRPPDPLVEPFITAVDAFAVAHLVSVEAVKQDAADWKARLVTANRLRAALIERYRRALNAQDKSR